VLFLWPVARLLSLGLSTPWLDSLLTPRMVGIIWFTVWQALLCAALSVALAIPGAYVLYLRKHRGQSALRILISVPFLMPTIVVAISFSSLKSVPILGNALFGHSAIVGIICAHIFMNYGLVVRALGNAWVDLDPASEAASALDGAGRLRTFASITLPQLRSVIISSALLVFLYCATSFGLVLVLGGGLVHSIETEMYVQALEHLELGNTAGLAIVQTLITVVAFAVFYLRGKPSLNLTEAGHVLERKRLDRRDWPTIMVTGVVVFGLILVPMISVMSKAFKTGDAWTFANFTNLASFGARDVLSITISQAALNSLRNILIATAIAMLVGLRVSYLLARPTTSQRIRRTCDTLFQLPIGVSTVVLGLGYLVTFSSGIFPLRSSWLAIPLAQALIATPLVIRLTFPAMVSIDSDVIQSAQSEGATADQIWWLIQGPLIGQAIRMATGYVAMISLGEFGATSFLAYGNQGTLPTALYQLISRPGEQNYGMAMATSAMITVLAIAILGIATRDKT